MPTIEAVLDVKRKTLAALQYIQESKARDSRAVALRKKRTFLRHARQELRHRKAVESEMAKFFVSQMKSANKVMVETDATTGIFWPRDWDEPLVNAMAPLLARGYAETIIEEYEALGIGRELVLRKGFCPTGPGGGIDNSCGGSGGKRSAARNAAVSDIVEATKKDRIERSFLAYPDGSVSKTIKGEGAYTAENEGEGISVGQPDDPRIHEAGAGIESVHTHPISSAEAGKEGHGYTGFSVGDIKTLHEYAGISTMTAVDLDGKEFSLTRTGGDDKAALKALWKEVGDAYSEVHTANLDVMMSGDRTQAEAVKRQRSYAVEMIKKLEAKGLVSYSEREASSARKGTKSTATDYLNAIGNTDFLEEMQFALPSGESVNMAFLAEYPDWMKKLIDQHLQETFAEDFWNNINDATLADIENLLHKGAKEGWSVETIAKEMRDSFGTEDNRYARIRGRRIARTELGNVLNAARTAGMDAMMANMGDKLPMKKAWLSVLGTTTRDSHAHLDGVPADSNGEWDLGGVKARWPSDIRLPASERINCQCTVVVEFGMTDAEANDLIQEYSVRVQPKNWTAQEILDRHKGFCPTGPGGGVDNTCGSGGGGDSAAKQRIAKAREAAKAAGGVPAMIKKVNLRKKDKLTMTDKEGNVFTGKGTSLATDGSMIMGKFRPFPPVKGVRAELMSWKADALEAVEIGEPPKPKKPRKTKPKPAATKPDAPAKPTAKPADKPADKPKPKPAPKKPEKTDEEHHAEMKAHMGTGPKKEVKALVDPGFDKQLARAAKAHGKSVEALEAEWTETFKKAVDSSKVFVAMPESVVQEVVTSGRYKSQFETQSSYGGDVQTEARSSFENWNMGVDPATPDRFRPVYGYASNEHKADNRGDSGTNIHTRARAYGKVAVRLKDHVKDRSGITIGDSMNAQDSAYTTPMANPSIRSVPIDHKDADYVHPVLKTGKLDATAAYDKDNYLTGTYTEVQIYGGLRADEIDTIFFPKEPSAKTKYLLKEHRMLEGKEPIKWQLM